MVPSQGVRIVVQKLHEDKHGLLFAEVALSYMEKPIEAPFVFNLVSSQSRDRLAASLTAKVKNVDWREIIKDMTIGVLEAFRQGIPAVKISQIPERVKPRYRVEPLIFEDEANLFYGDGDTGKSIFACFMAVLIQDNLAALGLTPQAGNVLLLDYETSEQTVKEVIQAIRKGLGIKSPSGDDNDILYRFCSRALADDIEAIQAIVLDREISFIIVDSMGMACGGDIERLEFTRAYFSALRSLKITSLTIHHLAKLSDGSKPYGSVYAYTIPRSEFLLRHEQEPGESTLYIGLHHKKCNPGKKIKPFGLQVDFKNNGYITEEITFSLPPEGLASIPALAKDLPIRERLKWSLKKGPKTLPELVEELGEREDSIRTKLNQYKGKEFTKLDGKRWGLLAPLFEKGGYQND